MLVYKRGLRRYKTGYNTRSLYKLYKKSVKNPVSYEIFMVVIRKFFTRVVDEIVYTGFEIKLPFRLGTQRIKKKLKKLILSRDGSVYKKGMSVDWFKTKKLWEKIYPDKTSEEIRSIPDKKLVYLLNEHTDGYRFKWYWDRQVCNIPNHSAYSFTATTWNREKLVKAVKEDSKLKTRYYE